MNILWRLSSIFLIAACVFGIPVVQELETATCGYKACHPVMPDMLNVHIVPHTHDDVGWLKTVDQYYYGSKSNIQDAGVQLILDSVISELLTDPDKRFIYVETAFFWKWWKQQHDTLRHQVKKLVNRGQLEFIGGAWSMNDEAVTHYQSIIDQFTWGLRKLNETFGDCGRPRAGWQIDPFGHSREMASLFAQMGYDGMLFGRLDHDDMHVRLMSKTTEMLWKGSASLGKSADLFTSILFNNYNPPPGFCFDTLCKDDPIIDDKKSPEYNVDVRVQNLLSYVKKQAKYYDTNNIILTMGGDFTYMDAHKWYKNLDLLIRYANDLQDDGSKINLLYSTPSCYLKAVNDDSKNKEWPVKKDDFFPYASDPHSYWTGYFTSRPTIKRFERMGNNFLQVCKQLYSLTDLGPEDWVDLNKLREAMGVMQHHDAITGTEKEHVANDYRRILSEGFAECEIITKTALNKLMVPEHKIYEAPKLPLLSCNLLNISQCDPIGTKQPFVVTLYNPLSRPVTQIVRLPVNGKAYSVIDPDGNQLEMQLVPIPHEVQNIPGRNSDATLELIFRATDLPPLGFKTYYVQESDGDQTPIEARRGKHHLNKGNIHVKIDKNTHRISHVEVNEQEIELHQEFLYYRGMIGNNEIFRYRSSGAYIFRPNGTSAVSISKIPTYKVYKGPIVEEIHQTHNDWVSQVIRTYVQENHVEFEWLVGPIPISDNIGKEIITRFTTQLKSNATFYTDSNGREMLKRVRNYRPTWNLKNIEPVAGNYYPITSKIVINDADLEMAVLTDRAQGGTSMRDGEVELMVHRRLLHDDGFGVGEALNETAFGEGLVVRGQHYLVVGDPSKVAATEKDIAQRKLLSAWTFISPIDVSYEDYKWQYKMEYSGLEQALPKNVQILTLEPWKARSFLLRLEHIFEKDEDPILSKPATVDVKSLFTPFTITHMMETTLGANQWLSDNERLEWKAGKSLEDIKQYANPLGRLSKYIIQVDTNDIPKESYSVSDSLGERDAVKENIANNDDLLRNYVVLTNTTILLQPMQIRTFVIEIAKRSP